MSIECEHSTNGTYSAVETVPLSLDVIMETNLFQAAYSQSRGARRDGFRWVLGELCGVTSLREVFDEVSRLEVHERTLQLIDARERLSAEVETKNRQHLEAVVQSLEAFDDRTHRIAAMCLGVNSMEGWSAADRYTMAKMQLFWSAWRHDFGFDLTYVQVERDLFEDRNTVQMLAGWILQHAAGLVEA